MKSPNLDQDITRQIWRQIQTLATWLQRWWISYLVFALVLGIFLLAQSIPSTSRGKHIQ